MTTITYTLKYKFPLNFTGPVSLYLKEVGSLCACCVEDWNNYSCCVAMRMKFRLLASDDKASRGRRRLQSCTTGTGARLDVVSAGYHSPTLRAACSGQQGDCRVPPLNYDERTLKSLICFQARKYFPHRVPAAVDEQDC